GPGDVRIDEARVCFLTLRAGVTPAASIAAGGILHARGAQIVFVEIDAVNRVVLLQKFCVLTGAARDVEYRARARHGIDDQSAQTLALAGVVLEVIDGVVELGTLEEHPSSLAIPRGGFTPTTCATRVSARRVW